ncbi:hypothetical protein HU200_048910 [Digitaria exilis]|uniref:Cytochrome P450 n=1 Tax=Digitaria exilis TaxID=1010633 RepID=A0A835AVV9_9POAL|nr:hypothetical protein HU200_048910 [Digitaria exilis]
MRTIRADLVGPIVVFLAAVITLRRAIRNAPILSLVPPIINVSDPAMTMSMLVDHAHVFANRPVSGFPVNFQPGNLLRSHSISTVSHGRLWRALRCNLSSGVLHPSRLAAVSPLHRDAVHALIATLSGDGGGVFVLRDALHTAVFTVVVRMCFGDGVVSDGELRARGLAAASRVVRLRRWRWWNHFGGAFRRIIAHILPLIAARRQQRWRSQIDGSKVDEDGSLFRRPYVDSLLDLRVPDDDNDVDDNDGSDDKRRRQRPLTDHEMAPLVWEFLGATTQTAVQEKLHQELMAAAGDDNDERLLRDMPYLGAVIQESLRLHPPVLNIVRDVAANEDEAAGVNEVVRYMMMVGDVGRDGKAWKDPGEFRPERFLAGGEGEGVGLVPGNKEVRMMPFGVGRRHCPGVGLGTMHIRCFVAALVREFEWAPPVEGDAVDMAELDALFKMMKTPLRARITPRP